MGHQYAGNQRVFCIFFYILSLKADGTFLASQPYFYELTGNSYSVLVRIDTPCATAPVKVVLKFLVCPELFQPFAVSPDTKHTTDAIY